jgi:hypothetical protein
VEDSNSYLQQRGAAILQASAFLNDGRIAASEGKVLKGGMVFSRVPRRSGFTGQC